MSLKAYIERGLASATGASTRKILVKIYPCAAKYMPKKTFHKQHDRRGKRNFGKDL